MYLQFIYIYIHVYTLEFPALESPSLSILHLLQIFPQNTSLQNLSHVIHIDTHTHTTRFAIIGLCLSI